MSGTFIDSDLAAFFDTDDFAETGTCGGSSVQVIRDREYLELLGGMIAGANPVALAKASQFVGGWNGSALVVAGTSFTIKNKEPQGDGKLVLLQLHE